MSKLPVWFSGGGLPTPLCMVLAVVSLGAARQGAAQNPTPRLPAGVKVHRDLAYLPGGHPRQVLDIYQPAAQQGTAPLVVWIHGGAWRAGDKQNTGPMLPLLEKGFVVASLNYRLSQHAVFPAQVHDCKAALRWLRQHADEFGFDPDRIGVGGASAGGHLAALLGTSGDVGVLEGETVGNVDASSRVQAVLDWYGPTDFSQMGGWHDRPNSPESQLLGGPVQENKPLVQRANPITYVSADDPPFLIMHGDEDRLVPFGQSVLLAEALRKAGVEVTLHKLEGAGHGGPEFFQADKQAMIAEFFQRHLRR